MTYSNTWEGVLEAAKAAGAKYPEVVAAQWSLESAHGTCVSGKNNYFGIKGAGTTCATTENYGHGMVHVNASFRDFNSLYDCIVYLVDRWYKDYRVYKGVNRATSADQCCELLKAEGYATDPNYVAKLKRIIREHV